MLSNFYHFIFLLCFLYTSVFADYVDTFYGPLEVNDPVIIEIIESPTFQRLKSIHQYGVAYYTTHREEYTRYDHCLGVFTLLRVKNASLEEQIAGLLHDVSHTVFSHVGDWIFGKEYHEKDYQSGIHTMFIHQSGLEKILNKHGYTGHQFLPIEEWYPMLEQRGPNLCADRIDYNIQGAFYRGYITYGEAMEFFNDLKFTEGHWISSKWDILKKLARFSIFMTEDCWGSAHNYFSSRWLADAMLRGIAVRCITWEDIHFGSDDAVWKALSGSSDSIIQAHMNRVVNTQNYFSCVPSEKADFTIISKFRGIDPWVFCNGELVRLSSTDETFAQEYTLSKNKIMQGWPVVILPEQH